MKRNQVLIGATILLLLVALVLAGCNKNKANAQSGGGDGGGELSYTKTVSEEDFKVRLNKKGDGVVIEEYLGKGIAVVEVPATIQGMPVTTLGVDAFSRSDPESIILPDSVTEFSTTGNNSDMSRAFSGMPNLKNIDFLKGYRGPIWGGMFAGCKSLVSITIPEGITVIRERAFQGCTNLSSIEFLGKPRFSGADIFYNTALGSTLAGQKMMRDAGYTGRFE